MSEKLSALIDNELNEFERAQVLKQLSQDRYLSDLWSRYHIIGLAMRREAIASMVDLPGRVSERLLGEQASGPRPSTGQTRQRSFLRTGGGLAAAALLAGVLLVGGIILGYQDVLLENGSELAGEAQIATIDDATRWEEGVDPQIADELNALLVEHGEFTSASGMNGLTAYTKFVAYDSQ